MAVIFFLTIVYNVSVVIALFYKQSEIFSSNFIINDVLHFKMITFINKIYFPIILNKHSLRTKYVPVIVRGCDYEDE